MVFLLIVLVLPDFCKCFMDFGGCWWILQDSGGFEMDFNGLFVDFYRFLLILNRCCWIWADSN